MAHPVNLAKFTFPLINRIDMKRWSVLSVQFVLLLVGCAPVYVPNVRNAPLFTKAGEFQGSMMYGTGDLDVQAAVAVTDNFALMGNYSYGNRNTDSMKQTDYHKHQFYEGAIGYYKNDKSFCFEVFLGYGKGEASSYGYYSIFSTTNDQLAKGKYTRIFLQPSFGFNKKVVNVAFTPRVSWVDFTEFSSSLNTNKIDPSPRVFFEPAVTAKFNFLDNRFFGTVQVGVSTPINGDVIFDYERINISTGLGIRLGGLHWDVKEKQQ